MTKTYCKTEIMRTAWYLRRKHNLSMSTALRAAWAMAKAVDAAADCEGKYCGHSKVVVNEWEKYGKSRTYVSCRHYTNAWNLKHEDRIGYIDNLTGEFVAA